jgi:hypothetical protein
VSSLKALPETTLGDAELVKLYLLDLERPHRIHQISTGKGGAVSSPAFGSSSKTTETQGVSAGCGCLTRRARGRFLLILT